MPRRLVWLWLLLVGLRRHPRVGLLLREVHADTHDFLEQRTLWKLQLDEALLAFGQVAQRGRLAEDILEDLQANRRLVVRGRHEDAARGRDLEAEHRGRVEVGEEDEDVVLLVLAAQVLDEAGAPRPLLLQPLHLVGAGVWVPVDPLRVGVERADVARGRVREPPHRHAADAVGALGVFVLPCDVVARAGREHVHVVVAGEALGDETAEMLGPAEDFRAVPLDDEGDSHDSVCSRAASSRMTRASPKSASRRRWPAITFARRPSSNACWSI